MAAFWVEKKNRKEKKRKEKNFFSNSNAFYVLFFTSQTETFAQA